MIRRRWIVLVIVLATSNQSIGAVKELDVVKDYGGYVKRTQGFLGHRRMIGKQAGCVGTQ